MNRQSTLWQKCFGWMIIVLVGVLLTACGGGGGGGGGGDTTDDDSGAGSSGVTTFPGGSLDDLRALNSDLKFDNLVITGSLSLPTRASVTIQANNLTVSSEGSIGYSYSTCTYDSAPNLEIQASGEVVIAGDITLNGRMGTSVTSGASCNSCYGQDGGDLSIRASKITLSSTVRNHGGSGGTYRDSYGSSSCSGGDSGNTMFSAEIVDLTGADIETQGGRGGYSCSYGSCGYYGAGTPGNINISATSLFKMNPGIIISDGKFTLQATQTDIVGPIYYGTLDSTITDNLPPTVSIVSPLPGETISISQPVSVRIEASDAGLGLRSFDVTGFGYAETVSAENMQNGILEISIPSPIPDTAIRIVARDNAGNQASTSVSGLSVSYAAEQEPNNTPATAQLLTFPIAIEGVISPSDEGTCDPGFASTYPDSDCYWHTAQDYFSFTVDENDDYIIELEFEGNQLATDIDMYLGYGGINAWTSSIGDNATTGNYSETINAYLWTGETFGIALQA